MSHSNVGLIVGALACCLALSLAPAARAGQLERDLSDEMSQINKSLDGLLSELAVIKREASGRLSQVRNKPFVSAKPDSEQIRQTKVSRFVLKRVAELELESLGMRDEMAKLFELQAGGEPSKLPLAGRSEPAQTRQEDLDFDEPAAGSSASPASSAPASSTTAATASSTSSSSSTASSTSSSASSTSSSSPTEEAAQIGFDLEALKRLGEEIGKRVDQFGKDAAKNLADLMEGIKLVFREPAKAGQGSGGAAGTTPMPRLIGQIKLTID